MDLTSSINMSPPEASQPYCLLCQGLENNFTIAGFHLSLLLISKTLNVLYRYTQNHRVSNKDGKKTPKNDEIKHEHIHLLYVGCIWRLSCCKSWVAAFKESLPIPLQHCKHTHQNTENDWSWVISSCLYLPTLRYDFTFYKKKTLALAGVAQCNEHRLQVKGWQVLFPIRAHAWVEGQVPSRGHVRLNHTLLFLSLSFSLPSPLSKV